MWDELSVARSVSDEELTTAVAKALGVDRERVTVVATMDHAPQGRIVVEKRPYPGDFALRVGFYGVPEMASSLDRIVFYRALARELATKLLCDDGELHPYTAMLVTPDGDAVRVNLDAQALDGDDEALVIAGLHEHVDSDEIPDRLAVETTTVRTRRGERLAARMTSHGDRDAFMAAYSVEVQDAEHALAHLLRELVHRPSTHDDERVLRRTCAVLRRAFPAPDDAAHIADLLACADDVLAGPWDPGAAA